MVLRGVETLFMRGFKAGFQVRNYGGIEGEFAEASAVNQGFGDEAFLAPAIDGLAVHGEMGGDLGGAEFHDGAAGFDGEAVAVRGDDGRAEDGEGELGGVLGRSFHRGLMLDLGEQRARLRAWVSARSVRNAGRRQS